MALEFSHRSSHQARSNRRRLLAATVLVVFLFLLDLITGGKVRDLIRAAGSLVWTGTAHVRTTIAESGFFATRRSLAEENAALREQLASMQEQAAGYRVLADENAQLRAALDFSGREAAMTAPIISSFTSSPYGTFVIRAGISDGVVNGNLVLSSGGFVIGVVSDAEAKTTEVKHVLAAGEKVDALIGETAVTILGDGNGNGHASVPLGVQIKVGDPVIAPAFSNRAIGIVGKVDAPPASPDQTIYIHLPINLTALRYVFIAR